MSVGILVLPFLVLAVSIDRQIADDTSQVGLQGRGTLGRDGLPCLQVGVVDTFLGIGTVASTQNTKGKIHAKRPVFTGSLGDGALVTLKV